MGLESQAGGTGVSSRWDWNKKHNLQATAADESGIATVCFSLPTNDWQHEEAYIHTAASPLASYTRSFV
ncbi:MAG: hypothetical protein MJY90_02865 [Bacteroidaceae bacterium]|nr:hypothetical protein [Bacteroidaceae bacterium]